MKKLRSSLSRRERQIMDVVYQRGQATAAEVREALPDAPGYSAVRALLRILEEKGHLTHAEDGKRYVFSPTQPRPVAAQSALNQIVHTFFGGSVEKAVTTLLSSSDAKLSEEELDRLARLIDEAKEGGHL